MRIPKVCASGNVALTNLVEQKVMHSSASFLSRLCFLELRYGFSSDALDPTVRIWLAAGHHPEQLFCTRRPLSAVRLAAVREFDPYIECASLATRLLPFPFRSIFGVAPFLASEHVVDGNTDLFSRNIPYRVAE